MINSSVASINQVSSGGKFQEKKYYLTAEGDIVDSERFDENGKSITTEVSEGKTYYQKDGKYFDYQIEGGKPVMRFVENIDNFFQKQNQEESESFQEKLREEKQETKHKQNQTIDDLMEKLKNQDTDLKDKNEQLNDQGKKIESLESQLNVIQEQMKKNNTENIKLLEELRKNKITENSEGMSTNLIKQIEQLLGKKEDLKNKYNSIEQQYDGKDILEGVETGLVKNWRVGLVPKIKKTEKGRDISFPLPSISFRRNARSRKKLNQLISYFNDIKNDPDKAIKYIMTQKRRNRLAHVTGAVGVEQVVRRGSFNLINKTGLVISKDKFEAKFDKQKEALFTEFKNNIKLTDLEKDRLALVEQRMNYYKNLYAKKHYGS